MSILINQPYLRFPFLPTARKFLLPPILSMSTSSPPPTQQNQNSLSSEIEQVLKYHNQTKHNFTRYARGPHNLDWANQPNPFRRYTPSPLLPLTHPPHTNSPFYPSIYTSIPSPHPLNITTLSQFFYTSLALSAWKSTGFSTWSLRVNPSSGNLHPTECYVICPAIDSVSERGFIAHYAPKEHALEIRAEIEKQHEFFSLLPEGSFLIGFSSIFWREAWKYGERAFRYCNHDVGHAIAAVTVAAAGLGWDVRVLDGLGYEELEKLMGLDDCDLEIESEHGDCVLLVFPSGGNEFEVDYETLRMRVLGLEGVEWKGEANRLSKEHVCWDVIYETAEVVKKGFTSGKEILPVDFRSSGVISEGCYKGFSVSELVRKRRSAVDMDGVTMMEMETFYQILLHCMPSGCGEKQGSQLAMPFRCLPWDCKVHCVLFVHRVVGLKSGLYFLVRNEDHLDELKNVTRAEFRWVKPTGCPDELPLYELAVGDCREVSKRLSCLQDIASDGCFSLGMVAHLESTLKETGSWMYPRVFWETGVLGQVLYLEAHAVGLSATGIGCFFDDPVHEILGLKEMRYQSLYHFTVGAPVVDKRIMNLLAYPGPDVAA